MATLVLRAVKGSPLTNTEMDNNFSNLNTDIASRVSKGGDTMTGALTLSGDPGNALEATTKQYTDNADQARLQLSGGTMTGKITTVAPDLTKANIRLQQGSQDPTTPEIGDVWNNGGAVKLRLSGSTKTFAFLDSNITGNAETATRLATARTINLSTDATGAASFDGTGDITIVVTAVRAPRWTTARSITATGDASWTVSVDGTANQSAALTLATVNSNTGTFGDSANVASVTVNAKGLVTAASSVAIRQGTTAVTGILQLTDSTSSTSTTTAATPNAVKSAYDLANAALSRGGGTMTGAITLAGAPSTGLHAATKTYVDDRVQIYNAAGARLW